MKNKILYIDISLRGHRIGYLQALVEDNDKGVALLPELCDKIKCKQIIMESGYDKKRSFINYYKWLKEIKRIIKEEEIELIHFLCGDALYRFFGTGLKFVDVPIIVTYHHMQFGKIRNISLKRIFTASKYGIVHTEHLSNELKKNGIKNVEQIEYPVFLEEGAMDSNVAKEILNLPRDRSCITILGGTQKYKGLDILLNALKDVNVPFHLYITGIERDFSKEYIKEQVKVYKENVTYNMKRLDDKEYNLALAAADLLVFPYRYEFDGASGPMIEGVWNRKYIVGAAHGSMGAIINKYKLGRTFKTEDVADLSRVLNEVLGNIPGWSEEAEGFRRKLTVKHFVNKMDLLYKETR